MTMRDGGSIVTITFFVAEARTPAAPDPQRAARARVRLAARVAARDAKVLARAAKQAAKLGREHAAPTPSDAKAAAARLRDLARGLEAGAAGKLDHELRAGFAAVAPEASPREVAEALRAALRPARRGEAEVLVAVVPVRRAPTFAGEPA